MISQTTTIRVLATFTLAAWILPGFCLSSSAQNEKTLEKVRSLIGQHCTVTNQDGSQAHGILWGFDGISIILKVHNASLYARAEKYKLDQILYLEDDADTRIDFTRFDDGAGVPVTLAVAGHSQPDASGSAAGPNMESFGKSLTVGVNDSDSSGAQDATADTERVISTSPPAETPRAIPDDVRRLPGKPQSVIPAPVKPRVKKPARKKRTFPKRRHRKMLYADRSSKKDAETSTHVKAPISAPHASVSSYADAARAPEPDALTVTDRERALQYQATILFSVVALLGILLIVAKLKGLGNGKSMPGALAIPAQVVRISGPYSIIDLGQGDGILEGEVVHFFHRHASDVAYCAKGRVLKVKHTYSAVEITERSSKWPLFVRDAAFRDCIIHPTSNNYVRDLWRKVAPHFSWIRFSKNVNPTDSEPAVHVMGAKSDRANVSESQTDDESRDEMKITIVSAEEEGKLMRAGIAKL